MKIDGRKLASEILKKLNKQDNKNSNPQLAVILIGEDENSRVYVRQKEKIAKLVGVNLKIFRFKNTTVSKLTSLVTKLNTDPSIHGIIIQRPIPLKIEMEELDNLVLPKKDVDGFNPKSLFNPPVALAVLEILKSVHRNNFLSWLKKEKVLIIGRGVTAGRPIAKYFSKKGLKFTVAHSQTQNLDKLCLSSNIVISCVGKPDIVRHTMLKRSSILIGVGLHPENTGLKPDYNQEEVKDKVRFYTPVPGGVGPLNVAMLMRNAVEAAKNQSN